MVEGRVEVLVDGVRHAADYEVDGYMLVLRSKFGDRRVSLGLYDPRNLAKAVLKALATRRVRVAAPSGRDAAKEEVVVAAT